MQLEWHEDFDDDDNSIWEAASAYHDDGSHFMFRVKPVLLANRVQWIDASDDECGMPPSDGETWDSLEEAKAGCEAVNKRIIENAKQSA